MTEPRVLVLGASGRLGGMLRRHWHAAVLRPLWQYRRDAGCEDMTVFDPLGDLSPIACLRGQIDVVLGLAGVTPGRGDLSLNAALGRAALRIGAQTGAAHVFLTSSAAVYGASDSPLHEDMPLHPSSDYGAAKLALEQTLRDHDQPHTILRIGNVAGADALLDQPGAHRRLDRFADGAGPRRSYIGPAAFASVLAELVRRAAQGQPLPRTLNIAQPGCVAMADLCTAAGLSITWQPAPPQAIPRVELDVRRLTSLFPVPAANPVQIVADWRADRALV